MKNLYYKLAISGMKGSRKTYLPYILASTGVIAMYYIIAYLAGSTFIASFTGGEQIQIYLGMGVNILEIFSIIFLFYTHSFLIRRRKQEFGLYNILGLSRRDIAIVMFVETTLIALLTISIGLIAGILLSKIAELALMALIDAPQNYGINLSLSAIIDTIVLFVSINAIVYCKTLFDIHHTKTVNLLHSDSYGEKAPKANWLLAIIGLVILIAAYYIALTIEDPIIAVTLFFFAVVLVIIATYMLFTAGSVTLCRLLQKNKKYYYKTNHFISVSSMAFRMKRNGAGLATICILSTMVLVTITFTTCMYTGLENGLRNRFPRNIMLDITAENTDDLAAIEAEVRPQMDNILADYGNKETDVLDYQVVAFSGLWEGDNLSFLPMNEMASLDKAYDIYILPVSDYNEMSEDKLSLSSGEAAIWISNNTTYTGDLTLVDTTTLHVTQQVEDFGEGDISTSSFMPTVYLFVNDFDTIVSALETAEIDTEYPASIDVHWFYGIDYAGDEQQSALCADLSQAITQNELVADNAVLVSSECAADSRKSFQALYGGAFYLGVILGTMFMVAAVMIIYYKQLTEGYEDETRFAIMQKVGMTAKEIRKSINSQILTVFFLPLVTAGIHLCFAFPLLEKILAMFNIVDHNLLVLVTGATFLVFALFYIIVYRMTSRTYYRIVTDMQTGN